MSMNQIVYLCLFVKLSEFGVANSSIPGLKRTEQENDIYTCLMNTVSAHIMLQLKPARPLEKQAY